MAKKYNYISRVDVAELMQQLVNVNILDNYREKEDG